MENRRTEGILAESRVKAGETTSQLLKYKVISVIVVIITPASNVH